MEDNQKTNDQPLEERAEERRRTAPLEASEFAGADLEDIPDMDADFLNLAAIIDLPAIRSLLTDLYKLTNMVLAILDLRGKVLIAIGWQDICTKFHRIHPETALNCTESDLFLAENVQRGEYVAYKCRNQLWDLVTPLYIGGKHAGNIYTGQFFYDDEVIDEDVFAAQAIQYGFDREAYLSALRRVPRFSREKVNDIMNFVSKFAVMVSELSYSNLELARSMAGLKQTTEALRESEDLLKATFDTIADGILVVDNEGRIVQSNAQFSRMWRLPCEIMDTKDDASLIASILDQVEDPEDFQAKVTEHYQSSQEGMDEIRFKDGRVFERFSCPVVSGKREVGRIWDFRDVSEHKRMERLLLDNEARLHTLVHTIPDLIWLKDGAGVYLCCNPPFERFFGAKEADIIGKTDYDFVDKELADFFRGNDRKALEAGGPMRNEEWLTFREVGYRGLFDTIKIPMHDAAGGLIGVLGISRDITERKSAEESLRKAEEKLRQSYKMEALGTMAGGIAHEFNNILASVLGYAELAKMGLDNREKTDGLLDEIIHAALRAGDLVRQILTFTRQTDIKREPMEMAPVIRETLKFLRASLPAAIHMKQEIPDSCTLIVADPTQIRQIIMNLCANAAYAMKEKGGVLDVRLAEVTVENGADPALKELRSGRYLRLVVSDTGCGISKEIIHKIFDPFFTTKQRGEASGMGLSVVHGIVKDMGGAVLVHSDPGKGSAFHIFFPKYEGKLADDPRDCR